MDNKPNPPSIIQGFTRQETIALTGIKSGNLSYLDTKGVVVPKKIGSPRRPKVFYTAEQVIQLKVIHLLRDKLSFSACEIVIGFLKAHNYSPFLFVRDLVLVGDELHLIKDWEDFGELVLRTARENHGKVAIRQLGQIGNVFLFLKVAAERACVPDFSKRIVDTPLAPAINPWEERQAIKGKLLPAKIRPPIVLEAD